MARLVFRKSVAKGFAAEEIERIYGSPGKPAYLVANTVAETNIATALNRHECSGVACT